MRLWPTKGRGPFEVHRKLLWAVVCCCILYSMFLGGLGIVVGRGTLFSWLSAIGVLLGAGGSYESSRYKILREYSPGSSFCRD